MKIKVALVSVVCLAALIAACSSAPKLASEPMPESGFLSNYAVLSPVSTAARDARIYRYRKPDVDQAAYTGVILDPIYLNQDVTKTVTEETIQQVKQALQDSMEKAILSRGTVKIVTEPGPGVARFSVGITGANSSADGLNPWSFTPIGLAINAAAYAGGVTQKTPTLLVESKIVDSQTKVLLGEGLVMVQGESFRTNTGSLESFIAMAKEAVKVAMETSAPSPTK
ncbi:MAG: DUF3313 domain-containing protein [Gammaproteobacteria bacterium]|nr:DUF3313 domain-containing protein [Gammaproteobacteria bacterium]